MPEVLLQPTLLTKDKGCISGRQNLRSVATVTLLCARAAAGKFRRERADYLEVTVYRLHLHLYVTELFQAGSEDTPVLDRPAPLRSFCMT